MKPPADASSADHRWRPTCANRWALALLVALGALSMAPGPVAAHSGIQSYVYVSIFDDAFEGRVEYPIADLGPAVGIDFPDDPQDRLELAHERAEEIVRYTDRNLELGSGDATWPVRYDTDFSLLETGNGDYLLVRFTVDEDFDETPRTFVVTYSGIIEWNPERDALFVIEDDWGSATFDNGSEHLLGFSVGAETQLVDLDDVSTIESMSEVARRGSVAVDRLLVIISMLVAVIAGATLGDLRRTDESHTLRAALVRLGWRVGLFTASAAVTFAAFGPTAAVTNGRRALAVGAVGVLAAAVSVRLERTAAARAAVVLAGGATGVVLAQSFALQQLDRSRPVLATLSFAVGAVATMAFVTALLLPLALLLRRWKRASTFADVIFVGGALAGLIWLSERLLGLRYPLRRPEFEIADAVTSPIIAGAVTAIVAAVMLRRATTAPPPSTPAGPVGDPHDEATERVEA